PDVPSTIRRKDLKSPRVRHSYGYEAAARYDEYGKDDYPVRRHPSYHQRRASRSGYGDFRSPPERVEEDEYWEVHAKKGTPTFRGKPDRQRSTSRHYSKDPEHYSMTLHDDGGKHNNNPPEHSRYAPLTSPKLVRKHPHHAYDSMQPKNSKGLRMGCY
ncbi:MAG: hypothetical protein SGILL_005380, partial [Bacillariaceae sp.]